MIDVGHVLDKYELLERVGQGGMAIVYRGLDRSLQREVAVKVLHKHLSDHQEARDRFEREAHAVAKLRHENILEIFDFKGKDDLYIVTEFIEGQTLKQFTTDHPPQYPEIGAMIVTQICRALAHAHAQGILHRDVKPENVMIRTDGVVKLMDFGISQMIDTQRLTVTGQLLGSPAYMSPEHVEGGRLDYRTDVFAAGIVLYQLTVGRLPFEGKNPHEILKRIAECKFPDPRHANARIGNELGRIILRAMAREPDARFRDMGEMLAALEKYLDGSGLNSVREELSRFFKAPAPYEMALKARLTDHLLRRAKDSLRNGNQAVALELLDRTLAIDPSNVAVTEILGKLGQRRRVRTWMIAGAAIVLAGGGAWALRRVVTGGGSAQAPDAGMIAMGSPDAQPALDPPIDGGPAVPALAIDAAPKANPSTDARELIHNNGSGSVPRARPDAGVPVDAAVAGATVRVSISPPDSEVSIGGGPWRAFPQGNGEVQVPPGGVSLEIRNDDCCEPTIKRLAPEDAAETVSIALGFLPAQIIPKCDVPEVDVKIDGKTARLGKANPIPFERGTTQTSKTVSVEFVGTLIDKQEIKVRYNETQEVTCKLE